jgi:putative intracellular protease/amidase
LIESFYDSDKPVAAVCHAPGVLHRVRHKGQPIVKDKRVTGFANSEEEAVHLTKVVPFLVEDELKRLGGVATRRCRTGNLSRWSTATSSRDRTPRRRKPPQRHCST